jgi:hypothetical protein
VSDGTETLLAPEVNGLFPEILNGDNALQI